jgi:hypothetical protein
MLVRCESIEHSISKNSVQLDVQGDHQPTTAIEGGIQNQASLHAQETFKSLSIRSPGQSLRAAIVRLMPSYRKLYTLTELTVTSREKFCRTSHKPSAGNP